jgi:hypothetical protein
MVPFRVFSGPQNPELIGGDMADDDLLDQITQLIRVSATTRAPRSSTNSPMNTELQARAVALSASRAAARSRRGGVDARHRPIALGRQAVHHFADDAIGVLLRRPTDGRDDG